MRFVSLIGSFALSGCFVVTDGRVDPPDRYDCPTYTATIFEPADGATVPAAVTTRTRWNEGGIPDRFTSMSDDFGNYFIPSGPGEVLGDGSQVNVYDLPAGGTFNYEVGWYCDAGNDGPAVLLAKVRFSTE